MTEERAPYGEPDYPSGPWRGFYAYPDSAGQYGMSLGLSFVNGILRGDGWDGIGFFLIRGIYIPGEGRCVWTKTYPGSHDVRYVGFRSGNGIGGTWTIRGDSSGVFRIWPGNTPSGEERRAGEQVEEPSEEYIEAVAPRMPAP